MAKHHDTRDTIPALAPDREEIAQRQDSRARSTRSAKAPPRGRASSAGLWLLILACLLAIGGLGAWNYLLHQQLVQADATLVDTSGRLRLLEQHLLVTDESMSQSGDIVDDRLQALDSEVRKLWDNVWKRAKQRLSEQEKSIAALRSDLNKRAAQEAELQQALSETQLALELVQDDVHSSADVSEQVGVLSEQLAAQQGSLAQTDEALQALQQANEDTRKRLQRTEEWVDAFNGYRTQMNRKLLALQGSVNALQGP